MPRRENLGLALPGGAWHAVRSPQHPAAHPPPPVWVRFGPFWAIMGAIGKARRQNREKAISRAGRPEFPNSIPPFSMVSAPQNGPNVRPGSRPGPWGGGGGGRGCPRLGTTTPTKNRPYLAQDGPNCDCEGSFSSCHESFLEPFGPVLGRFDRRWPI